MGKHPFVLSATVDFPDDVVPGPYDARLLDELLSTLKSMGVQRVYWLYYGDVDQESLWAGSLYENAQIPYGTQTLEAIGEPLEGGCAGGAPAWVGDLRCAQAVQHGDVGHQRAVQREED